MDLLIIMVVIWTAGKIFRYLKWPVVFGELIGGIIIGPAFLGIISPDSEIIKVLAELGIFFLMLHTGLETDYKKLFKASKGSLIIAIGGMAMPMTAGYFISRLFDQPVITSLFIGMSLSMSAIVLAARLFKDCNIKNSQIINLTIGAAVITDILGLVLFSVVLNIANQGQVELVPLLILLAKVIGFFAITIITGIKTSKFLNKIIYFGNKGFTLTLIMALFMGLIAEAIGLHIIIGAFLAGLFIREEVLDEVVYKRIEERVYGLSYGFFAPIFFASLAFHLEFQSFITSPLFLLAIVAVAAVGKVAGSGIASRILKNNFNDSMIIGLAMNNRGTVDLVIVTLGLQAGLINKEVFSILIGMAFITTAFSIIVMPFLAKKQVHQPESTSG